MNLILTHFDEIFGPTIFWNLNDLDDDIAEKLKGFIDLELGENLFELNLVDKGIKTINYYFELKSDWARGKREMALLTILTEKNLKPNLFKDILEKNIREICSTSGMFKAFHSQDENYMNDPETKNKFEDLVRILNNLYKEIEITLQNSALGNLLILGLSRVGKTTIIERLNQQKFVNVKPTLATQLINLVIESYRFKIVDVSGQKTLRFQWWTHTKNPDAIIYVLDVNDKDARLEETKNEFKKIMARYRSDEQSGLDKKTPLLILGNKIDLSDAASEESIMQTLELDQYPEIDYSLKLVSAKTGEGIEESFKVLIQKLLELPS